MKANLTQKVVSLRLACLLLALTFNSHAQTEVWWTGSGDGATWTDPANWSHGFVPGMEHTVRLGFDDGGNVSDQPQVIDLNVSTIIGELRIDSLGDRQVTVNSSTESLLGLSDGTDSGGRLLTMESTAQSDAVLNVDVGMQRNSRLDQDSDSHRLIFAGDFYRTPGTNHNSVRIRFEFNGNEIVFQNGLTMLQTFHMRNRVGSGGTLLIDGQGLPTNPRNWAIRPPPSGGETRLQLDGDMILQQDLEGNYTGTAYIEREGTGDRFLSIRRVRRNDPEIVLVEGQPGQGHLTVQIRQRWDSETAWFNTAADSTIEITGNQHMRWADNPGIGGEGNAHFRMSSSFSVERQMEYTGRTIIENGTVQLDVGRDSDGDPIDPATLFGQLPEGTIPEIADGAILDLSGQNQTLGGLSDYLGGGGEVRLTSNVFGTSTLTLDVESGETHSFSGQITEEGDLIKTGEGTQVLTGENTYTGSTLISDGALQLGDGTDGNDGTLDGTSGIVNNAELIFHRFGSEEHSGNINGSGAVVMRGTGEQILSGDNSYTGETRLEGGRLVLDYNTFDDSKLSDSAELVFEGGELVLRDGTHSEQVGGTTIGAGGSALSRDGGTGELDMGAIMRQTGGVLDIAEDGIARTSTANTNDILGGYATVGGETWAANDGTGVIEGLAGAAYEDDYVTAGAADNFDATDDGTFTGSEVNTMRFNTVDDVAATLNGDFTVGAGGILVTPNVGTNESVIAGGDSLTSGNGQDLVLIQHNESGDLVIGTAIVDSDPIGLTHAGEGRTILTAENTYSGATVIGGGTLQLGDGTDGNDGTIDGSPEVINEGTLAFNRFGSEEYGGDISGSGQVVMDGTGVQTLSGSNTYTGATVIDGGELRAGSTSAFGENSAVVLANVSGAVLNLDGFDNSIGSLSGGGVNGGDVELGSATLSVGGDGSDTVYEGVISGTGGVVKEGGGILTLRGNHTFTGPSEIAEGVLMMENTGASDGTLSGDVVNNGELVFDRFATTDNYSGEISGSGLVRVVVDGFGGEAQVFSGDNTYSGPTVLESGILRAGSVDALSGNSTFELSGGTTLELDGHDNTIGALTGSGEVDLATATLTVVANQTLEASYAGVISGDGGLTKVGVGTQVLTEENAYSGVTTISEGTLELSGNGSVAGNIENNSELVFDRSGSNSYTGDISGSGNVTVTGGGTQTLSGDSSYTGVTRLGGSTTLVAASNNSLGTGAVRVAAGSDSTLQIEQGVTLSNDIVFWNRDRIFFNTDSTSVVERVVGNGEAFNLGTTGALKSSMPTAGTTGNYFPGVAPNNLPNSVFFGGSGASTTARILDGTASDERTLTLGFFPIFEGGQEPNNDNERRSDVLSLAGTAGDIFALELESQNVNSQSFLGWLDGTNEWVNAIEGNSALGGDAVQGFFGSFADSGAEATTDYLGSWGVDTDGNAVWAVLDHNSQFAVIPEPGTWVLVIIGASLLMGRRRV